MFDDEEEMEQCIIASLKVATPPSFELREDGGFELREDGTYELRD